MDLWKLAIEKRQLQLKGVYPIVVWQNGKLVEVYIKQKSVASNPSGSTRFSPIKYETTTQMPRARRGKSLWQTESNQWIPSTTALNKIKQDNEFKTSRDSVSSFISATQEEIKNITINTTTQMAVTVPLRTLKPLPYLRKKAFGGVTTSAPITVEIESQSLEPAEESVPLIRTKETKAIETTGRIETKENGRYSTATTTTQLQPTIGNFTHNEQDYRKFPATTVHWGMATATADMNSSEMPSTITSTTEQLDNTESTIQTSGISTAMNDNFLEESINTLKIDATTEHSLITSVVADNSEISTIPSTTEPTALDGFAKSMDHFPIKPTFKPNIDYDSMDYVADTGVESVESDALVELNEISNDTLDIDVDDKQKTKYKMNETTSLLQRSLRNNFIRMNIFIGYFYALFVQRSIALNPCLPCPV